jgi:uncharacterized Zn-binding protein involved in type VI secretion
MGKPVIVKGKNSTGHPPGFPPTPAIQCSTKVFATKIGVVRQGDSYKLHCFKGSCHVPKVVAASRKVFANGKGIARLGDKLSCGDKAANGVNKVRAG